MKRIIVLFLAILFVSQHSMAQSPNWIWVKAPQGSGVGIGTSIATDVSGHIYVTGNFSAPYIIFGVDTLFNNGGQDIFVVKYDSTGQVIWAKSFGGDLNNIPNSIAADAFGNIYVVGNFTSHTLTFASTTLVNDSAHFENMFLAKIDGANGNPLWAISAGERWQDYGNSVTTDALGNVVVVGTFKDSSITFGSTTLYNSNLSNGLSTIYIVKFNSSGSVLWARNSDGAGGATVTSVISDVWGNIYFTGVPSNPLILDTVIFSPLYPHPHNIYIAKYNSGGHALWAKSYGGNVVRPISNSISCDASGKVFITGHFTDTLTFGSLSLIDTSHVKINIFTTKFDSSGTAQWAKSGIGISIGNDSHSINLDPSGNSYIVGSFSSKIYFGNDTLISNNGGIFAVKYDASGNIVFTKAVVGNAIANSVASDNFGNAYVTGSFSDTTIIFGTTILTQSSFSNKIYATRLGSHFTGIETIEIVKGIIAFPNPANTILNIHLNQLQITDCELRITDVFGREIYKETIRGIDTKIEVSKWSAGVYFYSLTPATSTVAGETYRGKIIVEK